MKHPRWLLSWSAIVTIALMAHASLPNPASAQVSAIPAPANVRAENAPSKVALTWDAVVGAHGYEIARSEQPDGPFVQIGESTALRYEDASERFGAPSYYTVTAVGHDGRSAASSVVRGVPVSGRELCAIDGNTGEIVVYDEQQRGDHPPLRRLGQNVSGLRYPHAVALDEVHGEVLVADSNRIAAFGLEDRGDAPPRRVITNTGTVTALAYDPTHDLVFAAGRGLPVRVYPRGAAGDATDVLARTIALDVSARSWDPVSIVFDARRNELIITPNGRNSTTYGPKPRSIVVLDGDATSTAPKYEATASSSWVDTDPATGAIYALEYGPQHGIDMRCVRRYERPASGTTLVEQWSWCLPDTVNWLVRDWPDGFTIDAGRGEAIITSMGNGTPPRIEVFTLASGQHQRTISGLHTGLFGITQLSVNERTHEYVVPMSSNRAIATFPAGTQGDVVPGRLGPRFGGGPYALAADAARGELYMLVSGDPAIHVMSTTTGAELRTVLDPKNPASGYILFEPATDRLYVTSGGVFAYARPTEAVISPVRRIADSSYFVQYSMAIDTTSHQLFVNTYGEISYYTTLGDTERRLGSLTRIKLPYGLYVYDNQLFVHSIDDTLEVRALSGTPAIPSSNVVRTITGVLTNIFEDDMLVDARGTPEMYVLRARKDVIGVYSPDASGEVAPLREIGGGPNAKAMALADIEVCK